MMETQLTALVSAALDVVGDPTSNLTAAVFLMAAMVLLVLIIVLTAIIVMLPGGRRRSTPKSPGTAPMEAGDASATDDDRTAPTEDETKASPVTHVRPARSRRESAWILAIGLVAALGAGYIGTAQSSYCLTCHAEVRSDARGGAHADTACVSCHEDTTALVSNTVRRASDIAAHYGIGSSAYGNRVPSDRCHSCHRDIGETVTRNDETGVMMSHAEPLEAGYACADCHRSEEHADMAMPVGMSVCLACHDAENASAECDTCHAKDTSAASGLAGERIYGTATITRTDCEGCHSMESCDACHGIRMPHPEEFLRTHPRYSGFHLKELCFEQCHTQGDCGKCHAPWNGHEPNFRETHKRYAKDSACNTCHDQHEGPMCDLCHDFNQ